MEIDKEKLKIDFSTIAIVFVLIALIIGGGIYHLVNRDNKSENIQNSVINDASNVESNSIEDNGIKNEVI